VRTFFGQEGRGDVNANSNANVRTFSAKSFGFFEIDGVSTQWVELVRIFFGQGVKFSRFCGDVFYGQTAPINFEKLLIVDINFHFSLTFPLRSFWRLQFLLIYFILFFRSWLVFNSINKKKHCNNYNNKMKTLHISA